jgi:hypothetical protein
MAFTSFSLRPEFGSGHGVCLYDLSQSFPIEFLIEQRDSSKVISDQSRADEKLFPQRPDGSLLVNPPRISSKTRSISVTARGT